MRKTLVFSGALILAVTSQLPAQNVRWNDRAPSTWADEPPRVQVSITGNRGMGFGAPVGIRFEVSDNAYVTVVRVDGDGRMTILFPYSRNQRAAVRAGQVHYVRNPRVGNAAFIANDRMGGFVFALASYVPLDFSSFENRDYDRVGGWSQFTLANRSIARRPDVFIDRFAARVLWDVDTPYDYDVDYYFPNGYSGTMNASALCSSFYRGGLYSGSYGMMYDGAYGMQDWDWSMSDFAGYPLRSMCRDYYNGIRCFTGLSLVSYLCNVSVVATGPIAPVPGQPTDTGSVIPNEGVIRGGLFTPTPVPVGEPDLLPTEKRLDKPRPADGSDLDNIMSIPVRATRKMKQEDARREGGAPDASPSARTGFDRTEAGSKTAKTADAGDASTRVQPPSREPTKVKSTPRPEPSTPRRDFGSTGRTSEPRSSSPDRDLGTRAAKPTSAPNPNPPSVQGTSTTDKKKPPM